MLPLKIIFIGGIPTFSALKISPSETTSAHAPNKRISLRIDNKEFDLYAKAIVNSKNIYQDVEI